MVTYHNRFPVDPPEKLTPFYAGRWGRVDSTLLYAQATRSVTMRLLVFRPGTRTIDRIWVAIHAGLYYRGFGLVLAVAITIVVAIHTPLDLFWSVLAGSAAAGAGLLFSWWMARPALAEAHGVQLRAVAPRDRGAEARLTGDQELFESLYVQLRRLDRERLQPVEYELRWSAIYDELEQLPASNRSQTDQDQR